MRDERRQIMEVGEESASIDVVIKSGGEPYRLETVQRWDASAAGDDFVHKLLEQLVEANFLAGYVRAINSGLDPDELYLTAARWLFDYLRYNLIVFQPAPGSGKPRVFSSVSIDSCREELLDLLTNFRWVNLCDVKGYESLGLDRHKPGGGFNSFIYLNLPDDKGSIIMFWGKQDCRQISDTLLSDIGESFLLAMQNSLAFCRQKDLSMRDTLTGLFNRRVFEEMLTIEGTRREPVPLSIVLIDLDDFKKINDTYGHQSGDMVLSGFGDFLRRNCREADLVARYGGEEFVVLLSATSAAGVSDFMERLLGRLAEKKFKVLGGKCIKLTVSIGCAQNTGGTGRVDVRELLRRADLALYRAKNNGKNQACIADNRSSPVRSNKTQLKVCSKPVITLAA